MKTYQFIILIGSVFGILLNGLSLTFLMDIQLNSTFVPIFQIYLIVTLITIYLANILIAFTIDKSKIVGAISIVSAIAIAVLLIPIPSGPIMSALLLIGGILAIIRKPE